MLHNVIFFICTDPTLNVTVMPLSISSVDAEPYNTFTLTCMATKPSSVIPTLDLSWYHNEMQLDNSIVGTSITEDETGGGAEKLTTLTVTSASSISSGLYSCVATVSVPESSTVTSNQTAVVTIRGIYIVMAFFLGCLMGSIASNIIMRWCFL